MAEYHDTQQSCHDDGLVAGMSRNPMPSLDKIRHAAYILKISPAELHQVLRLRAAQQGLDLPPQFPNENWDNFAGVIRTGPEQQPGPITDEYYIDLLGDPIDDLRASLNQDPNAGPCWNSSFQSVLPVNDASSRAEHLKPSLPSTCNSTHSSGTTDYTSDASWVQVTPPEPAAGCDQQCVNPVEAASSSGFQRKPLGLSKKWTVTPLPRRGPAKKFRDDRSKARHGSFEKGIAGPARSKNQKGHAKEKEKNPCYQCRRDKRGCKPGPVAFGPCDRCTKRMNRQGLHTLCIRYQITEAYLFRTQAQPTQRASKRWATMEPIDIQEWASDEILTVTVSQTFLDAPLQLRLRKFKPLAGDVTQRKWWNGSEWQTYNMPPYAIANLAEAYQSYGKMIESHVESYIGATIRNQDKLIKITYTAACRYLSSVKCGKRKGSMKDIFRFWVACRLTSNPLHIISSETLGMKPINDTSFNMNGKVPLPPIITPQGQLIIYSKFLIPLSKRIIEDLHEYIKSINPGDWYICYLSIFILLHSSAMIARRNAEYATQLNLKDEFADPRSIAALESSAITMLAKFHDTKKASVFREIERIPEGYPPQLQGFELDQIELLVQTIRLVKEKSAGFSHLRKQKIIHHDLYWVSQLYAKDWSPDPQP